MFKYYNFLMMMIYCIFFSSLTYWVNLMLICSHIVDVIDSISFLWLPQLLQTLFCCQIIIEVKKKSLERFLIVRSQAFQNSNSELMHNNTLFKSNDITNVYFEQSIYQTPTGQETPFSGVKYNIKCIKDQQAALMCVNKHCHHPNIFRCIKQNCKCKFDHERCTQRDSNYVFKYLYQKTKNQTQYHSIIHNLVKQKTAEINELKIFLEKQIQDRFKGDFLFEVQKKFLQIARSQAKITTFTSVDAHKIWILIDLLISQERNFIDVFQSIVKKYNEDLTKNFNEIKKKMVHFFTANKKYFQSNPEPFFLKQTTNQDLINKVKKKSLICNTEQSAQLFTKMFDKKIVDLQCKFVASENEFSLPKFFKTCGSLTDCVILCKTNKEKVIGAYTPLRHDDDNNNNWVCDAKGESFIYSLTDKERFVLKNYNLAIHRYKQKKYIQFGSAELAICDKANTQNNCFSDVNHSAYFSPLYTVNDKRAYLKFNGNETSNFTTIEWQAWKVTFLKVQEQQVR